MESELVSIDCFQFGVFPAGFLFKQKQVQNPEYEITKQHDGFTVQFAIGRKNVRINMRNGWKPECDVCVVGWGIHSNYFIDRVKRDAKRCTQKYPNAPILDVGNAQWKNDPEEMGKAELAGWKIPN